ncbi:hypothetical protein PV326_007103 [Microctonus aethiopoides]|nr:hypothetical protein PV326_007103 [Microctonus aethiopoides]
MYNSVINGSHGILDSRWTPPHPTTTVIPSPSSDQHPPEPPPPQPTLNNIRSNSPYSHNDHYSSHSSYVSPIYQHPHRLPSQIFMHKSAMQSAMHARDLGPGGLGGRPGGGVPGGLAGLGVGPGGMITGNEVKPHQCQQCLKSFSSNHQLVQHIRVHTGEKPYKCSYCDRRFKQLSHVQQHTRLHTANVIDSHSI